jgi:hypothetical protein
MTATDHLAKARTALQSAEALDAAADREDGKRLALLGNAPAWRASILLSKVCRDAAADSRREYQQHITATLELVA